MDLPSSFYDAVTQKDTLSVRIMMKDALLVDYTGRSFDAMSKHAASRLPDLYDSHNGEVFKDKSEWNDDYMDRQMVRVVDNFSRERIAHLKAIVDHIRPVPLQETLQPVLRRAVQDDAHCSCARGAVHCRCVSGAGKTIIIGAAAGLLAFGLATPLISSLAARVAIGAAVGCGAAYTCHSRSRKHE